MTRQQLHTREGRLRLVRTAVAHLLERGVGPEAPDDLHLLTPVVSDRLRAVGLTNATTSILLDCAEARWSLDGLVDGSLDPFSLIDETIPAPDREAVREGLIRGYEGAVDYCENLAVLPL